MEIQIETQRVLIRGLLPTDEKGMFEMDSDTEVHKYLGNNPVVNIDQSRDMIAFIRRQYIDNGIGRWAVIDKQTGEFAGWAGFKLITEKINNHINYYDFGYRFKRKFWGRGYATESSKAALAFGIEKMKLKNIYAMTDVDNKASRHVLEKLGFTFVKIFKYDGELMPIHKGKPTTWYKLNME